MSGGLVAPVQGQLIPMAIPLGAPRQLTGAPPPSGLVTPKASTHLVTATPVEHAPHSERAGSVKFVEHTEEPKPKLIREVTPYHNYYMS